VYKDIIFTNIAEVDSSYKPVPSDSIMPEWYKLTPANTDNELKVKKDGKTNFSIKKCMPVFDMLSSGYIILTESDLYVSKKIAENGEQQTWYEWSSPASSLDFYEKSQSGFHPLAGLEGVAKLKLNWFIKTPKGYSCLVLPPVHRKNILSILPGIIDSDLFRMPLFFPFTLNDPSFEGLIPAGTPVAQVIPFKREKWKMSFGKRKEIVEYLKSQKLFDTLFINKYKRLFWNRKEYK
jgi:hypothetical protein